MEGTLKILFVEDVINDAELIWHTIEKSGISFDKLLVDNKKDFLKGLKSYNPDIIISDYSLPQFDGMTALLLRNEHTPLIPFILVTGSINEEVAVECMKAGANDYVLKDNLSRLGPAVKNSIEKFKLLREKKDAEEELRKSEERFRHVSSTISDISYSCKTDPDGNYSIDWMTGATERITGYSIDEIKKAGCWRKLVVEEDMNLFKQHVIGLTPGSSGTCELRLKHRNRRIVWVNSLAECIREKDQPERLIIYGGLVDITQRKQADEALKESEQKYRHIFENIQDVYYETSIDGTILNLSPSISLMSKGQYNQSDLVGKSMYEFYSDPEERQLIVAALKEKGRVPDFEIRLKNRDGSSVPCSISAKISFNAQGHPEKIIGSMRDITLRKKNEEELMKAKEKAEESDRLKTAFLHNISHEIRTPMNAIVGFSALLGEPGIHTQTQQSYIETITQSSNHLLAIISDIIDISNIEANIIKTVKTTINVNKTLKSIYNQFLPKAGEKKIELVCKSELSDSDALILTDNTKLTQILLNLINNALKFTYEGSVNVN
jgi:PAS domain S-box-containing protein